jgi:UDP-N-acetylmuramate--alanine ligase
MYSRTALFLDEFAESFTDADEVVIADIFASRDTDTSIASSAALADAIERASGIPALAGGDVDATADYVADHLRAGDAVLVMGAGKSYRMARRIAEALADGAVDRPRSLS